MTEQTPDALVVAIETSGDLCSVAVLRAGELIVEQIFRHQMHLSEGLLDTMQVVLRSADATLAEVTAFAVGIGPGSFTGTRIGVMTAKTLAAVREIPLYGVISLEALAWAYRGLKNLPIVPILPCRTDVVFTARYDVSGVTPVVAAEPDALSLDALVEQLIAAASPQVVLCGAAIPRYGEALQVRLAEHGILASLGEERAIRAAYVGMLAHRRIAAGQPAEPAFDLVPLYVSPPPITMPKIPIPQ